MTSRHYEKRNPPTLFPRLILGCVLSNKNKSGLQQEGTYSKGLLQSGEEGYCGGQERLLQYDLQKIYIPEDLQGYQMASENGFPFARKSKHKTREGKWDEWWCQRTVDQGMFSLEVSLSQERL